MSNYNSNAVDKVAINTSQNAKLNTHYVYDERRAKSEDLKELGEKTKHLESNFMASRQMVKKSCFGFRAETI